MSCTESELSLADALDLALAARLMAPGSSYRHWLNLAIIGICPLPASAEVVVVVVAGDRGPDWHFGDHLLCSRPTSAVVVTVGSGWVIAAARLRDMTPNIGA